MMMFAGLPNGFTIDKGKSGHMMGQTWFFVVYYRERRVFEMTKEFDVANNRERYFARSVSDDLRRESGDWQEFPSLGDMVFAKCNKHRMGVE